MNIYEDVDKVGKYLEENCKDDEIIRYWNNVLVFVINGLQERAIKEKFGDS